MTTSFLPEPDGEPTPEARQLYDDDLAGLGYVMNASRLWAHQAAAHDALFGLLGQCAEAANLDDRRRGILITATASTLGDSYCSLAWGTKLADPSLAASLLQASDDRVEGLDDAERAMAAWARKVVRDPNGTRQSDVQELKAAGFTDAEIVAITLFVALRMAFSTVNDALGARPDAAYRATAPAEVLAAVNYGRPIAPGPT
ncbi:carboxymuconolactone decarboxylase family protein [Kribbella deserti]|uniref:Carboxymuconolactone decarboxylase family protein n=1 Tax=Kribbella deserti TaxID=1926257 RepID=A0ABV6QIF0_9ACTN